MLKINLTSLIPEETLIKQLGINRITAWRWRRNGKLSHYRIGKRIFYSPRQLKDFLVKAEVNPAHS
jgi:hypothetical protein